MDELDHPNRLFETGFEPTGKRGLTTISSIMEGGFNFPKIWVAYLLGFIFP